ncbi:hypothetical protein SEA_JONJAMES_108 [Gordonia Phage JonJames]|nr:hypothetical protein SEA_JONJAMES_108 [Gordonia Phage JonJames]
MTETDIETVSITELEEMVNNQLPCEVRHFELEVEVGKCEQMCRVGNH